MQLLRSHKLSYLCLPQPLNCRQLSSLLSDHGKHIGLLSDTMLRTEALRVYRKLFRQARALKLYDPICGSYVEWRARTKFRDNQHDTSVKKRKAELKTTRKHVRLLGKANGGNLLAMEKVVAYSYGTRGRLKHLLKHRIQKIVASEQTQQQLLGLKGLPAKYDRRPVPLLDTLPKEMQPLVQYCEDHAMQVVASKQPRQVNVLLFAQQHFESTHNGPMLRRRDRLYGRALRGAANPIPNPNPHQEGKAAPVGDEAVVALKSRKKGRIKTGGRRERRDSRCRVPLTVEKFDGTVEEYFSQVKM